MTSSTDQLTLTGVLSATRARLISALLVLALFLGIVSELLSIASGYYNMHKLASDATTANETAKNADRRAKAEADRAEYEAVISAVNKSYAKSIGKYP